MNKAELISAVASEAGVTKKDAEKVVKALISTITSELQKKDGKIQLPDIGSLKAVARAAREVRNPKTGEIVKAAACVVPKFVAAKALKEAVNK